MTIGERIRSLRKQNNLLQEELGKKIGVARQTVASWESDRTLPNMKAATAMAEVFDCDINDIAGDDILNRMEAHGEEEFLLLENFRKADKETRRMVMRMLKYSNYGD
jgi:DNA-binding XRE family transcriptional regulator